MRAQTGGGADRVAELTRQSLAAFESGDYAEAESVLRELIKVDGKNFVPWYNLACACSLQGKNDEAGRMLLEAIGRGFSDKTQLQRDPHLAGIRETETYRFIIENWVEFLEARAEAVLEKTVKSYPNYRNERNDALRLVFLSSFDERLFDEARGEVDQLARWWKEHVLPEEEPWRGEAGWTPAWVVVLLPSREDYAKWAIARFGPGWERIGGVYEHDEKRLIAKDLGATLRHEFWHVLHWRHQDRLGQRHPIWIMEGLCSLVEDVEPTEDGGFRPLLSWRTNVVKRLARVGGLTKWEQLFGANREQFMKRRPLAFYAQSRAVFMYLAERKMLRDWYATYVRRYNEDPTGRMAFELVFDQPLKEIESDFKQWARSLPRIADRIRPGDATLPFEVEDNDGGGLTVRSIITGPLRRAGLKTNALITSIDGRQVRDYNDLVRALSPHEPGDEVEILFHMRGVFDAVPVRLVKAK